MLKNRIADFYLKGNSKGSYFTERLKSRSKLDKRKNRYISNSKDSNKNKQNNFKAIESYSVKREKKINFSNFKAPLKNTLNDILKDKMSYIPDIERKKPESDFIRLINALVNSQPKRHNTCNNIFIKSNKDIPYKPKGYDYFEYIHQHPNLISEDDDNLYSKIVNDLKKHPESDNYRYNNRAQPITLNRLIKLYNMLNDLSSKENYKKIELKPLMAQSHKLLHKLNYSNDNNKNLNLDSKNDFNDIEENKKISKSESGRLNYKTIDYNITPNKNIFPIINNLKELHFRDRLISNNNYSTRKQKDYRKSDIFNLINDDLSKNKSSEKYLFKKNYMPQIIENDKKTSIIRVGWSPKSTRNKSRIGVPSVPFNILNPEVKSISPIKKEIDSMNNNNFEKPPLMSEYVNMIKPGDSSVRKDVLDELKNNQNIYHRKNYCAAYCDLYNEYKDLINDMF
jgi:hypothetical protein